MGAAGHGRTPVTSALTLAVVVAAGVGGSPEHRERFTGWASALCEALTAAPAPPTVRLVVERPEEAPPSAPRPCAPRGRSTRDELEAQLVAAGGDIAEGGGLLVVLIGHGSGGPRPRFNLPGPDLSPENLRDILARATAAPVTVAHLGSAAGAFVPALSGPGRVILAATRARETNETRFPEHFVAAFVGGEADRNRDGNLSALEAFVYARDAVERDFDRDGLLRTEHAVLDDNGDGVGSGDPKTEAGTDGVLASRTPLLATTEQSVLAAGEEDAAIRSLLARREELAARVDELRNVRGAIPEGAYFAELETLLLEIAGITEEIARLRGESDPPAKTPGGAQGRSGPA